ncbi:MULTISPECIES: MFS transporter [unclassified Gilliamella]|uniref:MFS transporter n=1 Tax=unclassified Gilliamella TaxID=2685620 RepID=UPI001325758A|nr:MULTISPECIES: MFS transporter [unclassified Gilliamella]MWN32526.1 MFS transporter [Gilliamella sp. Pra-s60]MWP29974.1 MFS transporter [Gilliamella sp. Pra-s54]
MNLSQPHKPILSFGMMLLMAIAVGITVASNYYALPLLHSITEDLNISVDRAGSIMTTAQFSYALGLLFIAPLGDKIERKTLIIALMLLTIVGLLISGLSHSLTLLIVGTAITGLFSAVAQVLLPFAATLAKPSHKGKVVGVIMSGMLLGILLGRTFAGAISTLMDWRMVYLIAASCMVVITLLFIYLLPRYKSNNTIEYWPLIGSIFMLLLRNSSLRVFAIIGSLSFALFCLFWTPLTFLLSHPPYKYSDFIIGLFGLAGSVSALGSPIVGKLSDKGKGSWLILSGLGVLLFSWLPISFAPSSIIVLIIGIMLINLAAQITHVSCLNAIYQNDPHMATRMNVGYMLCYFIGGTVGSLCSTYLFNHYGWLAVAIAGALLSLIAIFIWIFYLIKNRVKE